MSTPFVRGLAGIASSMLFAVLACHALGADGEIVALRPEYRDRWKVVRSEWSFLDGGGGLFGKGDSSINFMGPFRTPFTLDFNVTVYSGKRPRVHLGPVTWANEGNKRIFKVYPSPEDAPAFHYDTQIDYHVTLYARPEGVEMLINDQSILSTDKHFDSIPSICFRTGDDYSKGDALFTNITIKPSAPPAPNSPAKPSPSPSLPPLPAAAIDPATQAATAALVKTYRDSLVFVTGPDGAGSGFLANYGAGGVFLFTNAHVAAGVRGASFKTLDGTDVKVGSAACAVAHDAFLFQAPAKQSPLEIMHEVDENAAIGDPIVVLGNAEGAGVINTITGKIVGLGPQLVEVDAPFQPGNSGSPIIHLKSGKVIGLATYATIRKYDAMTKEAIREPVVRRFGYRLDSIKNWQSVNWRTFNAQAVEMDAIEKLTGDLGEFLNDFATAKKTLRFGVHNNPSIKSQLEDWINARRRSHSQADADAADQRLRSFMKVACEADVKSGLPRMTYDYFQRGLADQQKERDEILGIFDEIIKGSH